MPDSLTTTVAAAQHAVHHRMTEVRRPSTPALIRENQSRVDRFLIVSSQHTAAVADVLVPAASRHLDTVRGRDLARACRVVQRQLFTMKSRLYGSSQTVRLPWATVWRNVERNVEDLLLLEQHVSADLEACLPEHRADSIARRLAAAQAGAPTRPHPNIPHRGIRGRVARRLARAVDSFWDAVEGRATPAGVAPVVEGNFRSGGAQ